MQQCHGSTHCLTFVTSRLYCGNIYETDFGTFERGGCCCYRGFCFAAIGGILQFCDLDTGLRRVTLRPILLLSNGNHIHQLLCVFVRIVLQCPSSTSVAFGVGNS